jgi:hypothetical protein
MRPLRKARSAFGFICAICWSRRLSGSEALRDRDARASSGQEPGACPRRRLVLIRGDLLRSRVSGARVVPGMSVGTSNWRLPGIRCIGRSPRVVRPGCRVWRWCAGGHTLACGHHRPAPRARARPWHDRGCPRGGGRGRGARGDGEGTGGDRQVEPAGVVPACGARAQLRRGERARVRAEARVCVGGRPAAAGTAAAPRNVMRPRPARALRRSACGARRRRWQQRGIGGSKSGAFALMGGCQTD